MPSCAEFIGLRRQKLIDNRREFSQERRLQILKGLLQLAKEHVFDGVWSDLNTVAVKRHALGSLEYLTWRDAAALVEPAKIDARREKLSQEPSEGRKSGVGTRNGKRKA